MYWDDVPRSYIWFIAALVMPAASHFKRQPYAISTNESPDFPLSFEVSRHVLDTSPLRHTAETKILAIRPALFHGLGALVIPLLCGMLLFLFQILLAPDLPEEVHLNMIALENLECH